MDDEFYVWISIPGQPDASYGAFRTLDAACKSARALCVASGQEFLRITCDGRPEFGKKDFEVWCKSHPAEST